MKKNQQYFDFSSNYIINNMDPQHKMKLSPIRINSINIDKDEIEIAQNITRLIDQGHPIVLGLIDHETLINGYQSYRCTNKETKKDEDVLFFHLEDPNGNEPKYTGSFHAAPLVKDMKNFGGGFYIERQKENVSKEDIINDEAAFIYVAMANDVDASKILIEKYKNQQNGMEILRKSILGGQNVLELTT